MATRQLKHRDYVGQASRRYQLRHAAKYPMPGHRIPTTDYRLLKRRRQDYVGQGVATAKAGPTRLTLHFCERYLNLRRT
jgi:hypothetical protein